MTSLNDALAAKAERHELELQRDVQFLTVNDLATRWHVARSTVTAIPADQLPFLNLGHGLTKIARRYKLADVETYEAARTLAKAG